ncbi:MAG TPA: SGNH/GDSL hydrolase family protein [Kiritimatiellia bacterium]|nr:SGNH/GDSL hydrolase family protein [Kiritimatiellia bacterium]
MAKKILLALFGLVLALVLGEAAVRVFGLGPDIHGIRRGTIRLTPDPGLKYELLPSVQTPEGEVLINEYGMRNRPVALDKPAGVRRVACLGDSIAFGMGARRETFSVQLERELNAAAEGAGKWEVLNFGVPGYHIGQVAAMLTGRAAGFAPDEVLYLYCLNDPQDTSKELEDILRADGMTAARRDYLGQVWEGARSGLGRSQLWQWIRLARAERGAGRAVPVERHRDDMEHLRAGRGEAHYRALNADPAAKERLKDGMARIGQWSREYGVQVRVVVFPVFQGLAAYRLGDLHEAVRRAAEAEGLSVLDLLPVYQAEEQSGGEPFQADPLHPNERGYGIAARAVARAMNSD